jgi:hypothetical protein
LSPEVLLVLLEIEGFVDVLTCDALRSADSFAHCAPLFVFPNKSLATRDVVSSSLSFPVIGYGPILNRVCHFHCDTSSIYFHSLFFVSVFRFQLHETHTTHHKQINHPLFPPSLFTSIIDV